MDIISSERVDVLPGFEVTVFVNELNNYKADLQVTPIDNNVSISVLESTKVLIKNNGRQTYSIFPNDVIGKIHENVAVFSTNVEVATFEEGNLFRCPLCDQTYKTERGLKAHLSRVHRVIV